MKQVNQKTMKTIIVTAIAVLSACTVEQVPEPLCDCTTYTWQLVQRDGCLRQDTTDIFSFKGDCSRNNTGGINRETGVVINTICIR
jgi:hypothetical protein